MRINPANPLWSLAVVGVVVIGGGGCAFDPAGTPVGGGDGGALTDGRDRRDGPGGDGAIDGGCACTLGCEVDGVTCVALSVSCTSNTASVDDCCIVNNVRTPPSPTLTPISRSPRCTIAMPWR